MSKTRLLSLFLAAVLVLSLASCASGSSAAPAATTAKPAAPAATAAAPAATTAKPAAPAESPYAVKAPIKIEWWHALESQYEGLVKDLVEKYNASQPNITVEAVYQGSYADVNQKLIAAAAANAMPAVSVANTPLVAEYGASGLCEVLTPYIAADKFEIDDFGDGLIHSTSYDGKSVALPFLISTQVIYYNVDMAKAAGITLPTKWSEMDEFLKKATADGHKATAVPGWDQWYFETYYLNAGSKIIKDDNKTDLGAEPAIGIAKQFADWANAGYLDWCYGTDASTNMRQGFIDGKYFSVMHTSSLYNMYVTNCKFEVGMWYYPGNVTRDSEVGGSVLLMPAKNTQEVKNAGWQFLKYLTGKDVNMRWARETGYMPTRKSVLNTQEGLDFLKEKPAFQVIFDNLDHINPRIQHPGYSALATAWKDAMAKAILEKGDVAKGMQDAAKLIDEALADAK